MTWRPDYLTPAALADYVRIGDGDDRTQVELAIAAASRAVDRATRRQFGRDEEPVTRYYTARYDRAIGRWSVEVDDIMTAGDLTVRLEGQDVEVTDYQLTPRNNAADGWPWTHVEVLPTSTSQPDGARDDVAITGTFGWESIPDTVVNAAALQASRFLSRRDAPFGVAGSPEQGSEMRLQARVDVDVKVMLAEYVRTRLPIG